MLGDHATQLVTDSARSLQTHTLLHYNDQSLRSLLRESHSLNDALTSASEAFQSQIEPTPETTAELTISALALQRNMRAVMVYHQQRIDTLKDKFWENGGILSAAFGSETETRRHMATVDEGFAKGYAELCLKLKESWYGDLEGDEEEEVAQLMDATDVLGGGVDAPPPKDLWVSVRVVRDVGEVAIEGGTLMLSKGSMYHLVREEVESLIVLGYLEVIS
ncbi:DNA replication complex GINS protein PSF1 [Pseudohyphozyma bogoriensis]|nr:DNA replication complex GINS protein PSF1 [Pseudohyphozyma bogoriensis]